jgi:hypothetical protein
MEEHGSRPDDHETMAKAKLWRALGEAFDAAAEINVEDLRKIALNPPLPCPCRDDHFRVFAIGTIGLLASQRAEDADDEAA